MSTVVLARKYRPQSFDTLVGQEHVVRALSNALERQRLHHAYLFTGTRGVGKTTVSRILAKALNCTGLDGRGGITAHPCGKCSACIEIDAGRFVDYTELDAASNRGVDEISQLLDQSVYKPVLGRFKVYMIDEVHMLTNTAFNAMLKTLEEPPEYLKFVLATTDPQRVPATVLSRCLQFNLRPMAPDVVRMHLDSVLAQEGIAAEGQALELIARAARGSMRDALSIADQAIAFGAGQIEIGAVRQMLGAVDRSHALRLAHALADGDGRAVLAEVDALKTLGLSAAGTLEELAAIAQLAAVAQVSPEAAAAGEDAPAVVALAELFAADDLQLLYSIALHGRTELELAPDEYAGLVMVLLRVLAFRTESPRKPAANAPATSSSVTPAASPTKTAALKRTESASNAVRELIAQETHVPAAKPVSTDEGSQPGAGDQWNAVVQTLARTGRIGALVRELAFQAQCLRFELDQPPHRIQLRVEREMLRAAGNVQKLQLILSEHLGHAVELTVEGGAAVDTPAQRESLLRAQQYAEAEQRILGDPLVRSLMTQFASARIVPGSIKLVP